MCDVHVSVVVLAVGLALSLHRDMLASDLIIYLARPHGSWIFFWQNLVGRGDDPHLMMSVIWRSYAWKYRLSCFKCHLSGILFSLRFTCSMHTHTHTHPFSETCHSFCDWFFFWKRAEVRKIETTTKKACLSAWFIFKCFFLYYWKTKVLLMKGEDKLEYLRWQGSSV